MVCAWFVAKGGNPLALISPQTHQGQPCVVHRVEDPLLDRDSARVSASANASAGASASTRVSKRIGITEEEAERWRRGEVVVVGVVVIVVVVVLAVGPLWARVSHVHVTCAP